MRVTFWELDPDEEIEAVWGSAEEIAAGAQRWIDAGADTIVFQPHTNADIEEYVSLIGTQVRPLITG